MTQSETDQVVRVWEASVPHTPVQRMQAEVRTLGTHEPGRIALSPRASPSCSEHTAAWLRSKALRTAARSGAGSDPNRMGMSSGVSRRPRARRARRWSPGARAR
jgi:hypothetical protein